MRCFALVHPAAHSVPLSRVEKAVQVLGKVHAKASDFSPGCSAAFSEGQAVFHTMSYVQLSESPPSLQYRTPHLSCTKERASLCIFIF